MKGRFLRDFNCLNAATVDVRQLYDVMLQTYPDRISPGSLWGGDQRQRAGAGSPVTGEIGASPQFSMLMEPANRLDLKALHELFW
jgi:hypothetical protein